MDHPHFLVVVNQLNRELMKEILQTNELKLQTAYVEHLFMFYSCIAHVEHAGQDHAATEVGEAEEVYQEEPQQFVGEDQEQELEQELTNFVDTQGKHRFISNPV